MKNLKKMYELGTALTKQEQSRILAGDSCNQETSISAGGCTVVRYGCWGDDYPKSDGWVTNYDRIETTCSSGYRSVSYEVPRPKVY